jgi:hypothetical protein
VTARAGASAQTCAVLGGSHFPPPGACRPRRSRAANHIGMLVRDNHVGSSPSTKGNGSCPRCTLRCAALWAVVEVFAVKARVCAIPAIQVVGAGTSIEVVIAGVG